MSSSRIFKVLLINLLISPFILSYGQNLDSLLNNKRVYQTENIGDLPLPKIDEVILFGSTFYSVGDYSDFRQVDQAGSKELNRRLNPLNVQYDPGLNEYSFTQNSKDWSFGNPDFSFMQFRSNLVFRWEYNLGSTLYLVWAHDRSGFESIYNPVSEITGDLFGIEGNHVFMFKLNFWFSV